MNQAKHMADIGKLGVLDWHRQLPDTLVQSLMKASDLTSGWRKHIEALGPVGDLQRILGHHAGLGAHAAAIREAQLSHAQMLGKPYADILASARSITGNTALFGDLQRQIDAASSGVSVELMRMVDEMSKGTALRAAMDMAKAWKDPFEDIRKSLLAHQAPFQGLTEKVLVDSIARSGFHDSLKSTDFSAVWQELDAKLKAQASLAMQTIAHEAAEQATPEAALQQILAAIAQTSEPKLQKVLWLIVVPMVFLLLNAFLAPIGDFYVKKSLEEKPRQDAHKAVKQAASDTVGDLRLLSDHRYVAAKSLMVRSSASARSPAIGRLHFGQAVHVLQKTKDFTLVSWTSPDHASSVQGWVFSRYLKRFD